MWIMLPQLEHALFLNLKLFRKWLFHPQYRHDLCSPFGSMFGTFSLLFSSLLLGYLLTFNLLTQLAWLQTLLALNEFSIINAFLKALWRVSASFSLYNLIKFFYSKSTMNLSLTNVLMFSPNLQYNSIFFF